MKASKADPNAPRVPAVVAAGDRRASKAIHGESKGYLALGGRSLVAQVVLTLQRVPEVTEVWVVGDAERLEAVLMREDVASGLRKPIHIVPQFRNLFENVWQTYRRLLPGAGAEGRDPAPEDAHRQVLYLSCDLPFATPQEISEFVRRGAAVDCDHAVGVVTEESMEGFYPEAPGEPGIRMAYFNLREGRFRQSNLHLVKPARIGHRERIEEMYEHRYQRQFGQIVALAWRLLRTEQGGLRILGFYLLMHLGSFANRNGWRGLADRVRHFVPTSRVEAAVSALLRSDFRLVVTAAGGCGLDIDNEHDFDVAERMYDVWSKAQADRAERLYGSLTLAPGPAPGETAEDESE